MQGTNNIINFRWERFKHSFRIAILNIKSFIIYIFSKKKKAATSKNGKGTYNYNKKKKLKKTKY